jgi:hypothetical protein
MKIRDRKENMAPKANPKKYEQAAIPARRNPVRLTALLYLKDALLEERYEDCADFISIAYEFGARETDVEALLEDPRRTPHA